MNAPAPRTTEGRPDLSGMWGWQPGRFFGSIAQDLKPDEIMPWARALAAERMEHMGKDDPSNFLCMPQGPRMNLHTPIPVKIVHTPGLIVILSEDLTYRQIKRHQANAVTVEPTVLGKYVGTYDFQFPENPTTPNLGDVRLDGDRLLMGNAPLIPLSERTFAGPFGILEFVIDERGVATHFLIRVAEGELKAIRVE